MPRISSAGAWTVSDTAVMDGSRRAIYLGAKEGGPATRAGPSKLDRLVADRDAGLPAIGSRRAGRDRATGDAGDRFVDLGLHVGRELARRLVEGRSTDPVVGRVVEGQTALGAAIGDLLDRIRDRDSQVLLGARQDAGLGR